MCDSFAPAPSRRAERIVAMADACNRGEAVDHSPTEVALHINAEDLAASSDPRKRGDAPPLPATFPLLGNRIDAWRASPTDTERPIDWEWLTYVVSRSAIFG